MAQITPTDIFVTTRKGPSGAEEALAQEVAARLDVPLLARGGRSIAALTREAGRRAGLVIADSGFHLIEGAGRLGFHPNMAARRITQAQDTMARAAGIRPGDHVLDLTCGMGADAIMASHAAGPEGWVTAFEASAILAEIVGRGLRTYEGDAGLVEAMRRVTVVHGDSAEMIARLPDRAADVVLIDPMFEHARKGGHGLDLVRLLASDWQPDAGFIREAQRVAKRAVLMADRARGPRLVELGFEIVTKDKAKCWGRLPGADAGV